MPCGPQLIEAVAYELKLCDVPMTPKVLRMHFGRRGVMGLPSTRAIRYAISELIKQGRARRDKPNGPVYAVNGDNR